jgi:hypothetical protein
MNRRKLLLLAVIAGKDKGDPRQREVPEADYARAVAECPDSLRGVRIGLVAQGFRDSSAEEETVSAAVREAAGEYIILLNNDTEVITPDWIESMLEHSQRDAVAAVGARLLYPDGSPQHEGVIIGLVVAPPSTPTTTATMASAIWCWIAAPSPPPA